MTYTIYQLDAFTDGLFGGNPAAVIPLKEWIDDTLMQNLAMENNVSDTAFFVPSATTGIDYEIRWFTPVLEINLCGHATLATAFVLFNKLGYSKDTIRFQCKSGVLTCTKNDGIVEMDFPAWKPQPVSEDYSHVVKALGDNSVEGIYRNRDVLIELRTEEMVRTCKPDFTLLKKTGENIIITSRGNEVDFVSRFFAPAAGIDEDPVTGSAHSQLIPFWAEKSGKNNFHAKQLSERGGELWCKYLGERVTIAGKCAFYMKGEIEI